VVQAAFAAFGLLRCRCTSADPARGSIDLTAEDVARHAARGVDRLVVAPAPAEVSEQRDQLSALATRLALG